jgi:Ca2+/H+ antiporter, TMEM165/GDT1 family
VSTQQASIESSVFFLTFVTVFGAELAGDKLLYTIGTLATRFDRAPLAFGMGAAFMVKMGIAVLAGSSLTNLPRPAVVLATGTTFFGVAWTLWRRRCVETPAPRSTSAPATALLSFAAIVLPEWGDLGQITAAALSARFGLPLVVWVAAVAAMMTKGALAIVLTARFRGWAQGRLPDATLRLTSVATLFVLGILSVVETLRH